MFKKKGNSLAHRTKNSRVDCLRQLELGQMTCRHPHPLPSFPGGALLWQALSLWWQDGCSNSTPTSFNVQAQWEECEISFQKILFCKFSLAVVESYAHPWTSLYVQEDAVARLAQIEPCMNPSPKSDWGQGSDPRGKLKYGFSKMGIDIGWQNPQKPTPAHTLTVQHP